MSANRQQVGAGHIHLMHDPDPKPIPQPGIDEILDLEKISRGNGSFFSISSWRIEFSFLEMFSNVKILKKKFSFSSRNSRFGKKFSFSSRRNEILQTDSLSLLDSSLNFSSNSREKSYFALWVDFDHQCFAERESILKRQFCVVEQYSDFSLQKHFMETTTTKSLLWEGMVAQWKGQMQNMQE